ncbi:hypothetical protein GGH94_004707 [Coemansia aciculifera]|uniref:UspA domain-containing protein n=1 Tax=Coemansia aciculifera TaxID=417176 RepID=A0A9W8IET4_9FUNG|nr:hypothetical protein GGH94_004707 [Coemansia aciculifera]
MSSSIPLSLRRKVVIALDADQVSPATDDVEATTQSRFLSFKTVAWCKANILRPTHDHVFLITSIDPTAIFDGGVLSAMWSSLNGTEDPHGDRVKMAETALRRLAESLHSVGVSCTIEVLRGAPAEMVTEYVHVHRGEFLAVQVVGRSAVAQALALGWPEVCARSAECPTVLIKTGDLPENIGSVLDPTPE